LKHPIIKNWAGGVAQGEGPEFKPQYHKKKKKEIPNQAGMVVSIFNDSTWEERVRVQGQPGLLGYPGPYSKTLTKRKGEILN
jgi:hypothetical protein